MRYFNAVSRMTYRVYRESIRRLGKREEIYFLEQKQTAKIENSPK